MHLMDLQYKPSPRLLRQFAGLCLFFFGGLAAWYGVVHKNTTVAVVFLLAALAIGPPGLIWPRAVRVIYVGWLIAVFPIAWLFSNVILGCLFYGVITPVGIVFRAAGRDVLDRKPAPGVDSYWKPKTTPTDLRTYLRQF